jgi:hypothetical protein
MLLLLLPRLDHLLQLLVLAMLLVSSPAAITGCTWISSGCKCFFKYGVIGFSAATNVAHGSAVAGSAISSMMSFGSNAQNITSILMVHVPYKVASILADSGSTLSSMHSSGCDESPVMQQPSGGNLL